jgi:hypothetical protein
LARSRAQMMMKTVNVECFFLFKFGTGDDEKFIINVTEFVDSKAFAGGSASGSGEGDGKQQQQQQQQPGTPVEALSSSVRNYIKATARCFVDVVLFVPRCVKYVISISLDEKGGAAAAPGKA